MKLLPMKPLSIITLILSALFLNPAHAITDEAYACNKAYEQGDYAAAAALAAKALKAQRDDRDAWLCQGRTYSAEGDLKAALAALKNAQQHSKNALDQSIVALVTGHTYKKAGQYEEAIASYQESVNHAVAAKSKAFERVAQLGIGNVHFESKRYSAALATYLTAVKLDANDNERGESYEKIAETYHVMDDHDHALEYQIKAYFMHQKSGTPDQFAHSSIELGRYYAAAKNYNSAENTLNKIIQYAHDQGGPYYEAQGYYVLAQVKAAKGDMAAAKSMAEKAFTIARNTNDAALEQEIRRETKDIFY